MKLSLLGCTTAVALLAGVSNASADSVIFDGSSWGQTTSGNVTSQTTNGATTLTTSSSLGINPGAGADYVNLATPITANSGTWTLNMTVTPNVPVTTPGSYAAYDFGFGNNFTSTQSALTSIPGGVNPPVGLSVTPNSFAGPAVSDYTSGGANGGSVGLANYHGGGLPFVGGPFSNLNNVFNANGTPTESQTGPLHFQIVLNTNGPNWTLEFFKNDVQQSFQGPNGLVDELTYATNPGTLTQFGIDLVGYANPGGTGDVSATFSGISLTESGQVAAVPEPSTWAMMVLGFAGLGLLSYRRTRRNGGLNFRIA